MMRNILIEYFVKIRGKLCSYKKNDLKKFLSRHDYNQVCAVQDKDDYESIIVFRNYFEKLEQDEN